MARVTILTSGDGRLMRHLLDCAYFNEIEGLEIAGVVASDPNAYALTRARNMSVPCFVVDAQLFPNVASYGQALLNKLKDIDTDFVVLDDFRAGLGGAAKYYNGKIVGEHLSRVPEAVEVEAYLADEDGGTGKQLGKMRIEVQENDTSESLSRRVLETAELPMLMDAVKKFCEDN